MGDVVVLTDWKPTDTFALRLIALRHQLGGISQDEAAERCGIKQPTWAKWEKGSKPRDMPLVVELISRAFGCDRDWLMWGGELSHERAISAPVPARSSCFSQLSWLDPQTDEELLAPDEELFLDLTAAVPTVSTRALPGHSKVA